MVFIDLVLFCYFMLIWFKFYQEGFLEENWVMIKEYWVGLYYVLKDLDGIVGYML